MKDLFDKIYLFSFSKFGKNIEEKLVDFFCSQKILAKTAIETAVSTAVSVERCFFEAHNENKKVLLVFVGALGICVRKIAPFLDSKVNDAAVVCVDDCGKFVISVVGGHIGGANKAAGIIAEVLGATPVITTSTDLHEQWAFDVWATSIGFDLKASFDERMRGVEATDDLGAEQVSEKEKKRNKAISRFIKIVNTKSLSGEKLFYLGLGCKRGTEAEKLFSFVKEVFEEKKLPFDRIKSVSSIDLKKDEGAILSFAEKTGVEAEFFSAEELNSLEKLGAADFVHFSASEFVKKTAGVDCVCERSAFFASSREKSFAESLLIVKKISKDGMTLAVAL